MKTVSPVVPYWTGKIVAKLEVVSDLCTRLEFSAEEKDIVYMQLVAAKSLIESLMGEVSGD